MVVLTFPLSRIEGHARVMMISEHGQLKDAGFQATEFRGFYKFLRGQRPNRVFQTISRVCGVCTAAHSLATIKALEDVYDTRPPEIANRIRNIILLGQIIQSHATSLFIFTMPDILSPKSVPSIFQYQQKNQSFTSQILKVRRMGTQLMIGAGGQVITPLNLAIGGVDRGIPSENITKLKAELKETLNIATNLLDQYWELYQRYEIQFEEQEEPRPSYYITATDEDNMPGCPENTVRVLAPDGVLEGCIPYKEYVESIQREPSPISFADRFRYKGEMVRVGSLARINMIDKISSNTPIAAAYYDQFRKLYEIPSHRVLQYELARSIELVLSMEQALNLLDSDLDGPPSELYTDNKQKDGEGFGVVEAPRGVLIHHYIVKNNRIEDMELLIPTMYNILAMEESLKSMGSRYFNSEGISVGLEEAVGRVVRAFDPCLACATH